jgi:proline dehydrogenase
VASVIADVVRRAASRYVAGSEIDDAVDVASRLRREGYAIAFAYWDSGEETPAQVLDRYSRARQASELLDAYLSVKATALDFSQDAVEELVPGRQRLHFDAMAPDTVDRTWMLIDRFHGNVGVTLPGRWARSDRDAEWAVERGLSVRIVKGQWQGPDDRDPRAGFLSVVDCLAGRAHHVAVGSHDASLATEALARLRAAGTSCELEQLYGLRRARPPARVYLPFGHGWLPYALANLRRRPRTAWWLARDLARSALSAG